MKSATPEISQKPNYACSRAVTAPNTAGDIVSNSGRFPLKSKSFIISFQASLDVESVQIGGAD